MTIVSSLKPRHKSQACWENQTRALKSWVDCGFNVVYVGEARSAPRCELSCPSIRMVESQDFPTIKEMIGLVATEPGINILCNSDIVITRDIFVAVNAMVRSKIPIATSRRRTVEDGKLHEEDRGRDIFLATQEWWRHLHKACPDDYRIGHCEWDTWVLRYSRLNAKVVGDFRSIPCVYHPNHEDRDRPYSQTISAEFARIHEFANHMDTQIRDMKYATITMEE